MSRSRVVSSQVFVVFDFSGPLERRVTMLDRNTRPLSKIPKVLIYGVNVCALSAHSGACMELDCGGVCARDTASASARTTTHIGRVKVSDRNVERVWRV